MARVTVEDCIDKVDNRFELVMLASQRARNIGSGAPLLLDRDRDKNTVVSLREIEEELITPDELKENMIRNYQRVVETDDTDEDMVEHMHGELEWSQATASVEGDEFAPQPTETGEEGFDSTADPYETVASPLEELAGNASDNDQEELSQDDLPDVPEEEQNA